MPFSTFYIELQLKIRNHFTVSGAFSWRKCILCKIQTDKIRILSYDVMDWSLQYSGITYFFPNPPSPSPPPKKKKKCQCFRLHFSIFAFLHFTFLQPLPHSPPIALCISSLLKCFYKSQCSRFHESHLFYLGALLKCVWNAFFCPYEYKIIGLSGTI